MPSATAWNNIAEVPGAPPDNDCLALIPSNLEVMEIVLGSYEEGCYIFQSLTDLDSIG